MIFRVYFKSVQAFFLWKTPFCLSDHFKALSLSVNHFNTCSFITLNSFIYLISLQLLFYSLPKEQLYKDKWVKNMYIVFYKSPLIDLRIVAGNWFLSPFFFLPFAYKTKIISSQLLFKLEMASWSTSGQWDTNEFLLGGFLFPGKKKHIPDSCCCYCHFLFLPFLNKDSMSDLQQPSYHHEVTRNHYGKDVSTEGWAFDDIIILLN